MKSLKKSMEAKKNDFKDGKLRWDLLPLAEIEEIVKVYTEGAKKYGDNNWQKLPNGISRYKAALLRHMVEYDKGNTVDPETGCKHLAQVAWNAIAMLYLSTHNDDEPTTLLQKLDARIEKKVTECNALLDDICLQSDNEKARRKEYDAFNNAKDDKDKLIRKLMIQLAKETDFNFLLFESEAGDYARIEYQDGNIKHIVYNNAICDSPQTNIDTSVNYKLEAMRNYMDVLITTVNTTIDEYNKRKLRTGDSKLSTNDTKL